MRTPDTTHKPDHATDEQRTRRPAVRWDDRVLAAMMIVFGGIRVGLALGAHERFTAEPTMAAIMLGLGVLLLFWRD